MRIPTIEPLEARIAPAVLSIAGPVSVFEGNSGEKDLTFHVLLDVPSPTPLTVKINTVDGSATVADNDYDVLADFVLSIPANTREAAFTVKVNGDTQFEPDQSFSVVLSSPSAGHTLGTATATGTIMADADVAPKLSIAAATLVEGNSGTKDMEFTVTLTNAASEPITFEWGTLATMPPNGSGSATAGVDYTAIPAGTVATIPAGATSVKILVPILGDATRVDDGLNEVFAVELQNPLLGTTNLAFTSPSANKAVGTILNDDPLLSLDFLATQSPIPNEGTATDTTVNFIVKLSVAAPEDIVVNVSTVDGTAKSAGTAPGEPDYTAIDGSSPIGARQFTIQKGQTQVTVPVKVKADAIFEDNETFSLRIDSATMNSVPVDGFISSSLAVTIKNDESLPTMSLQQATVVQPASGGGTMNFPVTLSGPAESDITFTWSTQNDGLAVAGSDYTAVVAQTATIPKGQTTVNLPVTILGDADTADEAFRVNIFPPTSGTIPTIPIGGATALGTIRAFGPTISIVGPVSPTTEGNSGADREAVFTITRNGTHLATPIEVLVSTEDGTGTDAATSADGDFDPLKNFRILLPANVEFTTFVVKVNPDTKLEGNEKFSVRIVGLEIGSASYSGIGTATAEATITNDDTTPTLSIANATVIEKSTSVSKAQVVVSLSNPSATDVTFEYVTELDTRALGPIPLTEGRASATDFTLVTVPISVTIPAGQTSKTLEIDVLGDTANELKETFLVRISNPTGATILLNGDPAAVTITDDEPVISILAPSAAAEGSADGGTTKHTFTIQLDEAAQENIAVKVSTANGTAIEGADYTKVDGKWLIIPAGSRTATLDVEVLHDLIAEVAETFTVVVDEAKVGVEIALATNGAPVGGVALPQGIIAPATGTITNDDIAGLSISNETIIEGDSGAKLMTFTVTLSREADRDVTFTYNANSANQNTALAEQDFASVVNGTATIPAGDDSVEITVTILGDAVNESDETFSVTLSNAFVGADALTITDQFGTGTILNDERTVSIQPTFSVAENVAGGIALVDVTLSSISTFPVTVTFSLTDGTAKKGSDYADPTSLNVVIPAGQTTATISVPVTNDGNFEANETFNVHLVSATNAKLSDTDTVGTVTITNDDNNASKLSISDVSVSEQNEAQSVNPEYVDMTFTVGLSRASGAPIMFDWETLSGSPYTATPVDDYIAVAANTLTIPANTTSHTFSVKVKKDKIHEGNETLGVRIFNVVDALLLDATSTAQNEVLTTSRTVTGTISNDDSQPTISVLSERFFEGESGTSTVNFTVALSRASDQDVTFRWRTVQAGTNPATPGTALEPGVDYLSVAAGPLLTIPAGDTTATLSVVVAGDTDLERDETFLVQIVEPRLLSPSAPHVEGAGIPVTNGADAAGTIRRDEITAMIALVGAGTEGNDVTTTEAVEETDAKIRVTLSQAVPVGEKIKVGFSLIDGAGPRDMDATGPNDAKKATDYREVQNALFIEFTDTDDNADGDGNPLTRDIIVKLKPNLISELAETFTVKLNDATSENVKIVAGVSDVGTVTITDDEALPEITIADALALENAGTMTFTIKLSRVASTDVTVNVETDEDSALSTGVSFDFTGRTVTPITIPAGQTSVNYTVSIRNDAQADEGLENFFVRLSAPSNGTLGDTEATGTIVESNLGALKITDVSRVEGSDVATPAKIIFTVTRTGSSALEAKADYTVNLLAAAVGNADAADFVKPSELSGTVTIPAGLSSKTFEISLVGDSVAEGDEKFTVTLSNLISSYTVLESDKVATGTIVEDDVTVAFIDSADISRKKVFSQLEGNSGAAGMAFGVTLNQIATTDVVVTFSVTNGADPKGGATKDTDFTVPTALTVTIPAGQMTGTFTVPILGDDVAEGIINEVTGKRVETFTVNIVSATGATVVAAENTRTGEIVNDDAVFSVLPGARVIEGNSGTQLLVFSVELKDAEFLPGTDYTVDYTTGNALAVAGQDYTITSDTLTFTANGVLTVSVRVSGDITSEGDETLTLTLSNPKRNASAISAFIDPTDGKIVGTGTIQDDETLVSISDQALTEGDAGEQQMIFVLSMPTAASHPVVVRYSTVDGTAKGASDAANIVGKDFLAVTSGSVTIPAGQTTAQIAIRVFGDLVNEADEAFTVKLIGADGAAFGDDEGTATIDEDTDEVPTISIVTLNAILETAPTVPPIPHILKFRVSLSHAANAPVTFDWVTGELTATADDFTAKSVTGVEIPTGELFVDVEVPITRDVIAEGNERFNVTISNAMRGTTALTATDAVSVATILDDDAVIRVKDGDASIVATEEREITVQEGTPPVDVKKIVDGFARVNLSLGGGITGMLAEPLTVTYTITAPTGTGDVAATGEPASSTATSVFDYKRPISTPTPENPLGAGTFTKQFPAGTAVDTLFIDVDLKGDTIDEWDEKFVLTLIGVSGAKLDAEANLKSVVTITDLVTTEMSVTKKNDVAPTLSISDIVVFEGGSGARFVVRLEGGTTERDISMKWDAIAGTALITTDFENLTGRTLTIPAGQRQGFIDVAVVNDTLDEADETFQVVLTEQKFINGTISGDALAFTAGTDSVGVAKIAENDLRIVMVSGGSIVEGAAVPTSVTDSTLIATSTTTKVKFTIQLNAAPSSTPVKVNYTTADRALITSTTPLTSAQEALNNSRALANTVSLLPTTESPNPIPNNDYIARSGQLIFLPGETSKDVFVDIVSDNVAEIDESFNLVVSIPTDGFAVLGGSDTATGTIEADESVFKLVRVEPLGVLVEGQKAKFKVERSGVGDFASIPAKVFYSPLADPTAGTLRATANTDFGATPVELTFAATQTESSVFEINITSDAVAELNGEKFLVRLTNATNGVISSVAGESESTVVINDDDVLADPTVVIEAAAAVEGQALSFVVKLVRGGTEAVAAQFPITVSFNARLLPGVGQFATANDFPTGFSESTVQAIVFGVGEKQKTISVPTQQDSVAERAETMKVSIVKVEKDFGGKTTIFEEKTGQVLPLVDVPSIDAIGTITNDDTVITVNSVTQTEGNTAGLMIFTATIPAGVTFPVSFHYKTKEGTAKDGGDFTISEGDVTFSVGDTSKTFTVPIKGDTIREGNETFTVELSAATDATFPSASVTGTITNEDAGPQLTIAGGQVLENSGELVFTVSLNGEITSNVTVDFTTSDGTATSGGLLKDYVAKNGALTFTPVPGGVLQTKEIRVSATDDAFKEGNETLSVALSNAVGAELLAASAMGTILDGNDEKIGMSVSGGSVVEGGNVTFTFTLTAMPASAFAIKVSTREGSANASDITTLTDRLVQFSSGLLTQTVTVPTGNDDDFEPTERFYLDIDSITKADGKALEGADVNRFAVLSGGSRATGVILNDDQRIISAREFEFIDEDGDLVNVRVTKGALLVPNAFGELVPRGVVTLTRAGTVGGFTIDSFNFLGTGREFEGASLFVTRKPQAGFELPTDGKVNVGEVIAAQTGFAQLAQGVSLGTVKIDGDLGRIIVGSTIRPTSIGRLDVGSLGRFALPPPTDNPNLDMTQSILFGRAGSILVRGDFEGSMFVVGTSVNPFTGFTSGLGSVGSLTIQGKLIGGDEIQTGFFSTNSKIGKITVGGIVGGTGANSGGIEISGSAGSINVGNIIGGDGASSGKIGIFGAVKSIKVSGITGGDGADSGNIRVTGSVGTFTTLGDVKGGAGVGSGQMVAQQAIGKVIFGQAAKGEFAAIKANLIGGSAGPDPAFPSNSTQVMAKIGSGSIVSFASIGSVQMNGDIIGGNGKHSGTIFSNGAVSKITMGNVTGGKGDSSGLVRVLGAVDSFAGGTIQGGEASNSGSLDVNGRVGSLTLENILGFQGTTSSAASKAGSVIAGDLGNVLVTGNVKAAPSAAHAGGGSIFSGTSIGSLTVKGAVEGTEAKDAVIAAANNIGRININTLKFAEILAGYQTDATNRGTVRNADAQIGAVVINEFMGSSIIAGALPGTDGFFGQTNDTVPAVSGNVINNARLISKIASVTIKRVLTDGVTDESGIVAQNIGKIIVNGTRIDFADDPVALPGETATSQVFINKL